MAAKHTGLGRGLGALIQDAPSAAEARGAGVQRVPIADIRRNPAQPRRDFRDEPLRELVGSIGEHGILQPLLVRRLDDGYELIAGERRLRAAREAGLQEAPVLIMEAGDRESLELALIENLQREDLNPVEEAEGYRALMERFEMTQDQVAEQVGRARATVANALRLLGLPDGVKELLAGQRISSGHAKALLGLSIPEEQLRLARRAAREGLSVRAVEQMVRRNQRPARGKSPARNDLPPEHVRDLSDRLHRHFGTGVRVTPARTLANGRRAKGRIEIDVYSNEDLDRVLTLIGLDERL